MRFEWDPAKNEANIRKHKVSFEEAAEIWSDPDLMVLHAKKKGEKRLMAIGRTYTMLLSVIHTERGEDMVRIISASAPRTKKGRAMSATRNSNDALLEGFDAGEDMDGFFDFEHPEFPNREVKRVNVDFPVWMVTALDGEAARIGVNRQAVIKMWVSERLDDERVKRAAARTASI